MSTSTLKTDVAVLKNQVKDLQHLKEISQDTSEKIPLLDGRIDGIESVTSELKKVQLKIFENTQKMLIQQEKTAGVLRLIRKEIEHYDKEIQMLRNKVSKTVNEAELEASNSKVDTLEKKLNEKPNSHDVNRKIDRIWRFLYWIPGAVAAVILFWVTVFDQIKEWIG